MAKTKEIVVLGAGVLLGYSAITGRGFLSGIRALMHGESPAKAGMVQGISATAGGNIPASSTTDTGGLSEPVGSILDNAGLQALWIANGGNPAKAGIAACIATHESSGNSNATSPNPDGGTNVGLWQLDTPGGVGAGHTVAQLMDPATNARITIMATGNGSNWSEWATAPDCGV